MTEQEIIEASIKREEEMSIQEAITKAAVEGATVAITSFAEKQIEIYRTRADKLETELRAATAAGMRLQDTLNIVGNMVGIVQGSNLITEVPHLVSEHLRELQKLRMETGITEELKKEPPPEDVQDTHYQQVEELQKE